MPFARKFIFGEFYLRDFERPASLSCGFDATYFDAGQECRATIAPRNSLGVEGAAICKEFTAPAQAVQRKLVWRTGSPAAECVFRDGGAKRAAAQDGFFEIRKDHAALSFPDGVWDAPADARFMLTFDMHTVQPEGQSRVVMLSNLKPAIERGRVRPQKIASAKMWTPPGDSGMLRYVVEFVKPAEFCTYELSLVGESAGKVRFGDMKIERLK